MSESPHSTYGLPAPAAPTPPPLVPDYTLVRRIGAGSYGEVWLARNILGEWRAVKIVRRAVFEDGEPYEREFRGIRAYGPVSLEESSLLRVLHVGRDDGQGHFYYVMELADDASGSGFFDPTAYVPRTLKLERQRRGRLPLADCLAVGMELATALGHLHRRKLAHRDVKPSNVIFVRGEAKLADIGLVASFERTLSYVGSAGYLAPEGTGRLPADIYALGKVLYELVTGRDRLDFPHLPPLRKLPKADRKGILELNRVILKACNVSAAARYQSGAELMEDMKLLEEGSSLRLRRRLKIGFAAALGVSALLAGLLVIREIWSRSREEVRRREVLLQKTGEERRTERTDRWSDRSWSNLQAVAAIRIDDELRSQAAATLAGLDIRPALTFPQAGGSSVAFAPDGRWLVGGLSNANAFLVLTNGSMEKLPVMGAGPVGWPSGGEPLQFVAGEGHRFILREVFTGRARREFVSDVQVHFGPEGLPVLALTSDGSHVAAAGTNLAGPQMFVGDATTGLIIGQDTNTITSLAFAPDGSFLAAGRADGRISLWTMPGLVEQGALQGEGVRGAIYSLAFARNRVVPDTDSPAPPSWMLAASEAGGKVVIWNLASRRPRAVCLGAPFDVYALAFHPDGMTLASGGRSEVRLWDTATGQLILRVPASREVQLAYVASLSFSEDGRQLAVAGMADCRPAGLSVWTPDPDRGIRVLRGLSTPAGQVWFSPDGTRLAALGHNFELAVWDLTTDHLTHLFEAPVGAYADNAACAFNAHSTQVAFAAGRAARLYDLAGRRVVGRWELPDGLGDRMQFDERSRLLLVRREFDFGGSKPLAWRLRHLRPPDTAEVLRQQADTIWISYGFEFPAGGKMFIIWNGGRASMRRYIKGIDVATGAELWSYPTKIYDFELQVAVDPTGRWCVYNADGNLREQVLRLPEGRPVTNFVAYFGTISPSGEEFLGGGPSGGYVIRNRAGVITDFVSGPDWQLVNEPKFSPDGKYVALATRQGMVLVADLAEVRWRLARLSARP